MCSIFKFSIPSSHFKNLEISLSKLTMLLNCIIMQPRGGHVCDSLEVNGNGCSSRGPEFNSQHQSGSYLSITLLFKGSDALF